MNAEAGTKILPEDDAHIHPAQGVGLHRDFPRPKHGCYSTRPLRVAASNDHLCQTRRRVCVAEKHHVHAMRSQHSRSGPGCPLPLSTVQYLHHKTALHRRNGEGMIGFRGALGAQQEPRYGYQNQYSGRQREPDPAGAKLFQNLTVGSRIGHPDLIR